MKLLLERSLIRCEDAPADASSCCILSAVRWYPAQMRKVVVDRLALGVPVRLAREPHCSCEEVAPSWVHANDDAVVIHAQASGLCMAAQRSGRGEMPGSRASHQPGSTSSHTCRQLYLEACSSARAAVGGIAAPGMWA